MCGGIVGALSLSLPAPARDRPARFAAFLLAYNLGRILSYAGAGALFGVAGRDPAGRRQPCLALRRAALLAALVVVGIGLSIGGWLPRLTALERLGTPLWRRLEPLGRRLLPVRTLTRAALFGAVWGWLPCGLVYGMLISAPAQGGAGPGPSTWPSSVLGTLPVLLATGLLAGRLYRSGPGPALSGRGRRPGHHPWSVDAPFPRIQCRQLRFTLGERDDRLLTRL